MSITCSNHVLKSTPFMIRYVWQVSLEHEIHQRLHTMYNFTCFRFWNITHVDVVLKISLRNSHHNHVITVSTIPLSQTYQRQCLMFEYSTDPQLNKIGGSSEKKFQWVKLVYILYNTVVWFGHVSIDSKLPFVVRGAFFKIDSKY